MTTHDTTDTTDAPVQALPLTAALREALVAGHARHIARLRAQQEAQHAQRVAVVTGELGALRTKATHWLGAEIIAQLAPSDGWDGSNVGPYTIALVWSIRTPNGVHRFALHYIPHMAERPWTLSAIAESVLRAPDTVGTSTFAWTWIDDAAYRDHRVVRSFTADEAGRDAFLATLVAYLTDQGAATFGALDTIEGIDRDPGDDDDDDGWGTN